MGLPLSHEYDSPRPICSMEGSPPIWRYLRNAELPHQPLWIGCRGLAGVAFTGVGFTGVGHHPAIARGATRQKGYEFRIFLLVRGAAGDYFVGRVGSVDGVYQSLRIGFCGLSEQDASAIFS